MHLGLSSPTRNLKDADLILVIDSDVPWIAQQRGRRGADWQDHPSAGVDPLFSAYPMRGFPCDLAISGVLAATLPALTEALALRQGVAHARIEARRRRLAETRETQRAPLAGGARQGRAREPHSSGLDQPLPRARDRR